MSYSYDYDSDKTPSPPSSPSLPPYSQVVHRKRSSYRLLPNPPASPRPLPTVPQQLSCRNCRAYITNPLLVCKSTPRRFKGFSGDAALFQEIYNAKLSAPQAQLMITGAHTVQLISCSHCDAYLGLKFVKAYHSSEKWKEGRCMLEMDGLVLCTTAPEAYGSRNHTPPLPSLTE
ncbi:hypothetical protein BDV98DRAFT_562360 [Pterulicium gracile]|uniref:Yippee domain-containing protein n=1 Tax=Pterulicium gracile TaxID=1884261 RepID=A0A5C3QVH6_9AGAR|nr:hypothetical protein BDV98DRAFT_562360 [Pterula gracilis]